MYRTEGRRVYQAEKQIAMCFSGHQGQPAEVIAERIAMLLNKDFGQFCVNLCAQGIEAGTAETLKDGSVHESPVPKGMRP